MTTNDELRALIAAGDKATLRPWDHSGAIGLASDYYEVCIYTGNARVENYVASCYSNDRKEESLANAAYITAAANLAPEIARELIEAREALAKANEDAARLAKGIEGGFFHSNHYCYHCGMGYEWGDEVQEIQHTADCPITLHRARIGGDK